MVIRVEQRGLQLLGGEGPQLQRGSKQPAELQEGCHLPAGPQQRRQIAVPFCLRRPRAILGILQTLGQLLAGHRCFDVCMCAGVAEKIFGQVWLLNRHVPVESSCRTCAPCSLSFPAPDGCPAAKDSGPALVHVCQRSHAGPAPVRVGQEPDCQEGGAAPSSLLVMILLAAPCQPAVRLQVDGLALACARGFAAQTQVQNE